MNFDTMLAQDIWAAKYRYCADSGQGDSDYAETISRVATAVCQAEKPEHQAYWNKHFSDALADFKFIPAGRILAGAGTGRNVTLFNCFVMGTIPDSLDGIFIHLTEAALTMQQGGGIGMDFSTIRPKGSRVHGVGSDASGPLSFMDCWDAMCRTVQSAGQRRGAMMGCLRIDHPDIEAFIDAKHDPNRMRNFNLSVLVTERFMQALAADDQWPLIFDGTIIKTISAKTLWERLMRSTYDAAEPGVIFIDRVNQQNNLAYCEILSASNPCGEQMLPPYGACLLGSINLASLVDNPFAINAMIDEAQLAELTHTAVRFLDNVIDISRYPLASQEAEAKAKRRLGLGITGLADALLFCGTRYGEKPAVELMQRWLEIIKREAYRASAELAAEKGVFPLYDPAILEQPSLLALDEETRALISENGLRNGCLTSIAPTGTTSLLAGNISSGVEPVFAYEYTRKVRQDDGSSLEVKVEDYALRVWKQLKGDLEPPQQLFVCAQNLKPADHIIMQSAAQTYIDSSISKTVNCPEDISFEDFADVYIEGYHLGCKGLTTYRPNAVTGSVLSVTPKHDAVAVKLPTLTPRAESLDGTTYKLKWPGSPHAVYVTINDSIDGGIRRPFEIFINSKNMDHYAWTLGLTRMISAVFRRGGDLSFVSDELQAVFDPRGGTFLKGKYVPSLLAAIGDIIELHIGTAAACGNGDTPASNRGTARPHLQPACPQCGGFDMIKLEGCSSCQECGYANCG